MEITEKDLVKLRCLKQKYKNLKKISDEDFEKIYLARCESCLEVCFEDELKPIMNFKGDVYKCCEECQKELLNEIYENDYELTQEEYDTIYQEESKDLL